MVMRRNVDVREFDPRPLRTQRDKAQDERRVDIVFENLPNAMPSRSGGRARCAAYSPRKRPPNALNFDPRRALTTTLPPVIAACVLALRYMQYKEAAGAANVTLCLIGLVMGAPSSRLDTRL